MFSFERSLKSLFTVTYLFIVFTIAVFTVATLFIDKQHREKANSSSFQVVEPSQAEFVPPFMQTAIIIIFMSCIFCLLIYVFLRKLYKKITMPIAVVSEGMNKIAAGENHSAIKNDLIHTSFTESQKLCHTFNELTNSLESNSHALKYSEQSLLALVSSTNDCVILADHQMHVLLWNQGAAEMFQYTQEEMEGNSFSRVIPEQYKQQHQKGFMNFVTTKEKRISGTTIELAALRKDGTEFPIELTITPWEYRGNVYFYGIIRDISKRKAAEQAITTTQSRFRSAFENSGVGIALATASGKFVYLNPAFAKLLMYDEAEILQLYFTDITHCDDLTKDKHLFEKLQAKTIEKYQVEKRFYRKDKEMIWVCLTISNVELPNSDEMFVIAMAEDITAKKQAEEALKRSEDYLSHIVEAIPSGVIIIDPTGTIIFANSMATDILNLNRRKTLNGRMNILALEALTITGEPFANDRLFLDYLVKKGKRLSNFEILIQKLDGKFAPISLNATPLIEDGNITGILVSFIDISERMKTEYNLKKANEVLEELSMTDALTGIANRRQFNDVFAREWSRHVRNLKNLSLVIFDIDYFKEFNDTYGHQHGDECLKIVANTAERCLKRPGDFVARFGGEEFIVILPETNHEGAIHVGEEIRTEIERLKFPHRASKVAEIVTVSVGVATAYGSMKQKSLIAEADKALYQAKLLGRNQVVAICTINEADEVCKVEK